jgi:hypothetical protein
MFKRLVRRAIADGRIRPMDVAIATDDGLIHELSRDDPTGLALRLRERRLAKRILDLPAVDVALDGAGWPADDPDLCERVEDSLARDAGLVPGELFLDFPAKPSMFGTDLPLLRRDGALVPLESAEGEAHLGLPRVAAELYRSARRLRVFTVHPASVDAARVVELVRLPGEAVAAQL